LTARAGEPLLRARLGVDASIEAVEYGAAVSHAGVSISLHPAGHILGSAQVRLERRGEIWVMSGDYKLAPDPTCAPFEPVTCHTFITESTFGLPIFRWPEEAAVLADVEAWWRANQEAGCASVLFAHALGKAQRVLARIDESIGPIFAHGAVESVNAIYRDRGARLASTRYAGTPSDAGWNRALILAPLSAAGSPWLRRFGEASTAMVSGWMRVRGTRRRRSLDRGFVISDHADWPDLQRAIRATGASQVWVTHGYRAPLAHWLSEQGIDAHPLATRFEGEQDEAGVGSPPETPA
jgi:putative mRNA 3-end processing factor